ncbi:MAG: ATP-binding protein [Bacteroidales bacterium]
MDTPFVYGRLATGKNFTDREKEVLHLYQNFLSGTNTTLISPRRWGKSSLVKKAGDKVLSSSKNSKVVYLDMFNIRTEEDFYKALSEGVLNAVSGKMEELFSTAKNFLKQWVPKITFSPDAQQEISLGLNWSEVKKQPDEILDLPENIAIDRAYKIIICIDEFQNISYFKDPLAFQKRIRSFWQKQQNTTYCLYGSKRHMLMDVFTSPSMPFYKFGDLMFLDKIPLEYWKEFIQKRFKSTGKKISKKQAAKIASYAENHPYYVQQLAQLSWFRTNEEMTDEIIDETLESLTLQLSLLFQSMTESLSSSQVNFLNAVISEAKKLSSKDTIKQYKLCTSANVSRVKNALIGKEIIDERIAGEIEILDPIYKIWLKKYYFGH